MLKVLKLSQEAAVRFLEAIPRAHDLLVIFFDQDIRISRYESERQQGLFERIYESKSGGNTALYDSIAVYLSRVQGQAGRKVLVLFTDGEDTTSTLTQGEALRFLRESGVIVYTIGFTEQVSGMRANQVRAFMNEMARMTGGQAFWPDTSKALPKIYDDIIEDLEGQYVLGYVPQGGSAKAGFRKLKIVVKKPGLKARHRNGYLAPGSHPDAATP
ncbi:MAG: VWA domain-containing protein [Vicinamibacteria bacterium]|nr:VWA domain-containing protein [Vicinamibacteria bacterium]